VKGLLSLAISGIAFGFCFASSLEAQTAPGQDQKNTEIERKFLVVGDAWKKLGVGTLYRQGYLSTHKDRSVRVRTAGDQAFLTIKGASVGISRREFEYQLPVAEANLILTELCEQPLIEKTRYRIDHNGVTWVVDEFHGDNSGLLLAEVELKDPRQPVDLPSWVDKEVSDDARYYNANLIKTPYKNWPKP